MARNGVCFFTLFVCFLVCLFPCLRLFDGRVSRTLAFSEKYAPPTGLCSPFIFAGFRVLSGMGGKEAAETKTEV